MSRRKKSPELVEKCGGTRHWLPAHPEDGKSSCLCQCGLIVFHHATEGAPDGLYVLAPEHEPSQERTNDVP